VWEMLKGGLVCDLKNTAGIIAFAKNIKKLKQNVQDEADTMVRDKLTELDKQKDELDEEMNKRFDLLSRSVIELDVQREICEGVIESQPAIRKRMFKEVTEREQELEEREQKLEEREQKCKGRWEWEAYDKSDRRLVAQTMGETNQAARRIQQEHGRSQVISVI